MTARPEVVTLLADVDLCARIGKLGGLPDTPIGEFIRESKHKDGRLVTEAEAELIGSASADDFSAVTRLLGAEADFARDLDAARERLSTILEAAWGRLPPGSTVNDALDSLPPAEWAEAQELAARLFPDGYVYPGGGGPAV